jgi:hypothetical protein
VRQGRLAGVLRLVVSALGAAWKRLWALCLRHAIVVSLIASVVCTAATRYWALSLRQQTLRTPERLDTGNQAALGSMDSYALALMLGGLRGPLVMMLWTSSETQKTQHDLEDFDTKVEWIRLLQPEFDSVHVFEIWNKAYNISVVRASLSSKYSDILDALNYARRVDAARPSDINILTEIGRVYFDKLGNSTEQAYYRHRVQSETLQQMRLTFPAAQADDFRQAMNRLGADPLMVRLDVDNASHIATAITCKPYADRLLQALRDDASGIAATCDPVPLSGVQQSGDPGWRPTEQERLVDFNGQVLPKFLSSSAGKVFHTPDGDYDGADEQFLADYAPYPYGVSAFAIAYNYNKRCRLLMDLGQKHLFTSNNILDSQTPLSLKEWSLDELGQARQAEMRMDDTYAPEFQASEETLATRNVDWKSPVAATIARDQAIYSYDLALRLCTQGLADYQRHIQIYPQSFNNFNNHVFELRNEQAMCQADLDYLKAPAADPADRQALLQSASDSYQRAIELCGQTILKFYADDLPLRQALDEAARLYPDDVPAGTTNQDIDMKVPLSRIPAVMQLLQKYNAEYFKSVYDQHHDERVEREVDIERAQARLRFLPPPTTVPASAATTAPG